MFFFLGVQYYCIFIDFCIFALLLLTPIPEEGRLLFVAPLALELLKVFLREQVSGFLYLQLVVLVHL